MKIGDLCRVASPVSLWTHNLDVWWDLERDDVLVITDTRLSLLNIKDYPHERIEVICRGIVGVVLHNCIRVID